VNVIVYQLVCAGVVWTCPRGCRYRGIIAICGALFLVQIIDWL